MSYINFHKRSTPTQPSADEGRIYIDSVYELLSHIDDAGVAHIIGGMELLGAVTMASTTTTTGVITIPARTRLMVLVYIAGYGGGGDIASLRFNGDSGNNYWSRHLTAAAGGTTLTNTQNASTSLIRLGDAATNNGRVVTCNITNIAIRSKPVTISTQTLTGAAATVGTLDMGAGEWVNTAAQITSIEMLAAGANTIAIGSGFVVFGSTF